MLVGYLRVSTDSQNLSLQEDALQTVGCGQVFKDVASGSIDDRPGLQAALAFAKKGDVLVVWRLDRLGRSLRHLVTVINELAQKGVGFRTLNEQIDTTTAQGRLTLHIFAALAEFERELCRSRTYAGLEAARARGRVGGRKAKLTGSQLQIAQQLFSERNLTVQEIADSLHISRATVYRNLKGAAGH
jgi:DNA invertase Pin-like site-specific DNA recombinase